MGTVSGGVADYTITTILTYADSSVRPGMTAAVSIVLKEANNVLLVPNHSITTVDGNKVVYVLVGQQVSPVNVNIGLVSDTKTEVSSPGLKSGDTVITNPSVLTIDQSSGIISFFNNLLQQLGVIKVGI